MTTTMMMIFFTFSSYCTFDYIRLIMRKILSFFLRILHPNYPSPFSASDLHLNMPVNLLHTAITFDHFLLFHSELKT